MRSAMLFAHNGTGRSIWRIAFWGATTAIAGASLTPRDALPPLPDLSDKLLHALAYAAAAALGAQGWCDRIGRRATAAGLIALGGALEIGQLFVPGRSGEWTDVVANAAGVLVIYLIYLFRAVGRSRG